MIRISSFNVNGIRAAQRKGITDWVAESNPDIVCLQELRAHEHQIPESIRNLDYHGYYHTAEKKGYSGTGILTKEEPLEVIKGIGKDWIDEEGRIMRAEYEHMRVCSIYAPSGTTGDERQDLKMEFLALFLPYARNLLDDDKPTLFCGDFNIAHTELDIHNPKRNKNTSGFLPEEREWLTSLLETGYTDVYRSFHQDTPDLYSWWSYRAASKERNKGWRIDYQLACPQMQTFASDSVIEKKWDISDHAPVTADYHLPN